MIGAARDRFGTSLIAVGDLDGDNRTELAVGATQSEWTNERPAAGPGFVRLCRGSFGEALWQTAGPEGDKWFGRTLRGPFGGDATSAEAVIYVASDHGLNVIGLLSGDLLTRVPSLAYEPLFDLDADGWPEVLSLRPPGPEGYGPRLLWDVVSPASGNVLCWMDLRELVPHGIGELEDFAVVPDRGGDGRPDLLVALSWGTGDESCSGCIALVSVPDQRVLWRREL